MKKCKHCAEEIQQDARICKHCGRKQGMGPMAKIGLGILAAIVLANIVGSLTEPDSDPVIDTPEQVAARAMAESSRPAPRRASSPDRSTGSTESMAYIQAKEFVRASLRGPSSADFPFLDFQSRHLGEQRYQVTSYVDAQNAFGATERHQWAVTLRYKGSGEDADIRNWELERLLIDGKLVAENPSLKE